MDDSVPVELLPALQALLQTQSVTAAARALHVGQPAMSRSLQKLRQALGDELLVRQGRSMVRTRHAESLLPQVQALWQSTQQVLRPAAPFEPATAVGVVTLALGDDLQAMLVGPLLARLRAAAPGLDVRVRPPTFDSALAAQRGEIDLCVLPDIRDSVTVPGLDDLVLRRQYTRRFVTVSRRAQRWTRKRFAAADHVLVAPQGQEGGYVDESLASHGLTRRVAAMVPGFLAAIELVRHTDLVATLPDDLVRALAPDLCACRCPVATPALVMCMGWAPRFNADPRHRFLRTHVEHALRALAPPG